MSIDFSNSHNILIQKTKKKLNSILDTNVPGELRVWQQWLPKFPWFSYRLFYINKPFRQYLGGSVYLFSMMFNGKKRILYRIPKGLFALVAGSSNSISFLACAKKYKNKLKPFMNSLALSILGLTFRFKIILRVRGLGYKAYVTDLGKTISLKLGLSYVANFKMNNGTTASKLGIKDRMFAIEGNCWVTLTNIMSRITHLRRIDYYRGKGIFKKFFTCRIRQSRKKKNK